MVTRPFRENPQEDQPAAEGGGCKIRWVWALHLPVLNDQRIAVSVEVKQLLTEPPPHMKAGAR